MKRTVDVNNLLKKRGIKAIKDRENNSDVVFVTIDGNAMVGRIPINEIYGKKEKEIESIFRKNVSPI